MNRILKYSLFGIGILSILLIIFIFIQPRIFHWGCYSSGGKWTSFSSSCTDTCDLERGITDRICTLIMGVMDCDCGPDKCWNGEKCVGDGEEPSEKSVEEPIEVKEVDYCEKDDDCKYPEEWISNSFGDSSILEKRCFNHQCVSLEIFKKLYEKKCIEVGGQWVNFISNYEDKCSALDREVGKFYESIIGVNHKGCDCGLGKCWDGETCVGNKEEEEKSEELPSFPFFIERSVVKRIYIGEKVEVTINLKEGKSANELVSSLNLPESELEVLRISPWDSYIGAKITKKALEKLKDYEGIVSVVEPKILRISQLK